MTTDIQALLNIRFPIIQAPMAGVSTPELAAAVSNAGGLGSIAIGACSVEQARQYMRETFALTQESFNVNLFCHRPALRDDVRENAWLQALEAHFAEFQAQPPKGLQEIYRSFVEDPEMLKVLLEEKPAVVSFHFGLPPQSSIDALKAAGIVLLACVTNVDEALQVQQAGVDALIAQGYEAGGHRGIFDPERDDELSTLDLVRLVAERVQLPIIAAGGIMDGADIAKAFAHGASAVQLGTAFLLCPESATNAAYREALTGPRAHKTQITSAISGRPARGMVNRAFEVKSAAGVPDYPRAYDANKALNSVATAQGCSDFAAQWAGTGAYRARAMPAAQLIEVLMAELQAQR
ncbi:TPA: nitronate monooxygenase [Pseudomonas putida]|nr:nitronate monooxygenase [Pseudomonas putida]